MPHRQFTVGDYSFVLDMQMLSAVRINGEAITQGVSLEVYDGSFDSDELDFLLRDDVHRFLICGDSNLVVTAQLKDRTSAFQLFKRNALCDLIHQITSKPTYEPQRPQATRSSSGELYKPRKGFTFHTEDRPERRQYKGFLLDMDGVLQRTGKAIPGAAEFLTFLLESKSPFLIMTNESRYGNAELSSTLNRIIGVEIPLKHIYTCSNSARDFLLGMMEHGFYGSCYVIGESGLLDNIRELYRAFGKENQVITRDEKLEPGLPSVEYVIIGNVTFESTPCQERAATFLLEGARLLYTCPDYYAMRDTGGFEFGCPMSTVTLLEKVTGCQGYNVGKPNPLMLRMALKLLMGQSSGLLKQEVLFVGDSLDTDIRTSVENGIDCVLVLSGTTTASKIRTYPLLPTYAFKSISELHQAYITNELEHLSLLPQLIA